MGELCEALAAVEPHLLGAMRAWVLSGSNIAEGTGDLPSLSDFEEAYCGQWESFETFAEPLADDIGLLAGIPESVAAYFDLRAWK